MLSRIRLLIADDNAEFRKSAELMVSLERDIQVVSLARDGQEAVEMARSEQPDVAVIDVHMPKVDGLTAIRALANVSPTTVCMAMSYDGEREVLRQAMAAGAREYLIKPFNTDEFLNAIRRVAVRAPEPPKTGNLNKVKTGGLGSGSAAATGELSAPANPPPTTGSLAKTGALEDADRAREQELIQLAVTFLKTGRTDNEAARVYAELVKLRNMDPNTLTRLAEIFLARRDWQTLRLICERLEKLNRVSPPK
ncbi:MAG: response regulator transcription factor [Anaerolineales bacterium]|nr:response regulator transcription factor [Anaerolineales bacterium]